MKYSLYILLFLVLKVPVQSQIWEKISTPFDYITVSLITSINNDVYVKRFDPISEKTHNYKYNNNDWVRAEDDTLYEIFGDAYRIEQFKNRILVSCRNGIFLSNDSALNWIELPKPGDNTKLYDIDISSQGIFVISNSYVYPVYKLDEFSGNWEQLFDHRKDTTLNLNISELKSNSKYLFGIQQIKSNPWNGLDTLEGGIYISIDKGNTWDKTLIDTSVYSLYATDDFLLVSTTYGNLLRSEDNGKTWTSENIGTTISEYFNDGNRLLASSYPLGIVETKNDGKSWQVLKQVRIASKIFKKDEKYFFLGYGNLVYESDSLFETIVHTNLIDSNTNIENIYNQNDTILTKGSFKRGVQYSTDFGDSWHTYYPFLEQERINISYFRIKDNQVYLSVPFGYYVSTDYGKTFDFNPSLGVYSDLLILNDKILIYGSDGRLISKDFGKTYSNIDTTLIKNNFKIGKISQTTNSDLIAFSTFNGVFKSSDNADTWTKLVDSLPTDTTFASINYFYEFSGNYYAVNSTPPRILKSSDKGLSWQKLEIELFNEINNFFLEMIDENNILISSYGKGLIGLRITNDQGKSWRRVDSDLPELITDSRPYRIKGIFGNSVFVDGGYKQFVGQGSLYRANFTDLGIVKSSVESEIERNYLYTYPPYPNPAKSEVKVHFYWDINIPMTTDDISIYDITGKKIDAFDKISLVKQESHYGNLIWDCSSVQSGIYLINIKHGTEEKAVKVVVE